LKKYTDTLSAFNSQKWIDKIKEEDKQKIATKEYNNLTECIKNIRAILPTILFFDGQDTMKSRYTAQQIWQPGGQSNMPENDLFLTLLAVAGIDREELYNASISQTKASIRSDFCDRCNAKLELQINNKFHKYYTDENIKLVLVLEPNAINVLIKSGDNRIEYTERSNGLRWYLNLFISLLEKTDLETPTVIVLDEPGIYLHVKAQIGILEYFSMLAKHNIQIIYSTHSPFMLNENRIDF